MASAPDSFSEPDTVSVDAEKLDSGSAFGTEEHVVTNVSDSQVKSSSQSKRTHKLGSEKSGHVSPESNKFHSQNKEPGVYGQTSSTFSSRKYKGGKNKEYPGYRNYDKTCDIPFTNKSSNNLKSYNGYDYRHNHRHLDKPPKEAVEGATVDRCKDVVAKCKPLSEASGQGSMGCVVNGRYMRKNSNQPQQSSYKTVSPSGSSNFRQNNYKNVSYRDNEQRYGNKKTYYKNSSNFHNFETENPNVPYQQTYRQDFSSNPSYNSPRHVPQKNFRRKEKYNNGYKLANDVNTEENFPEDFEDVEPYNFKGNSNEPEKELKFPFPEIKEHSTQRDRLIEQLDKGECECMVCCELMRVRDQVWNCSSCYHVFHLRCIKKWARSPAAIVLDCGWRCPACQNVCEKVPYNYYCFCGKCKEPEVNHHYTPHSCGELCGRQRDDKNCSHRCNLLCHPGPCPSCSATVNRSCACGKTKKAVPCSQSDAITCASICEKLLNCGHHKCPEQCHVGNCNPCSENVQQSCFCGKNERQVLCDSSTIGVRDYCCNMVCNKKLLCSNHNCSSTCHFGPCPPCTLLPYVVSSCPCGKHVLEELYSARKAKRRTSCIDPIPVCDETCDRLLPCGPKGSPHKCNVNCHMGDCPPCPLVTSIKCQCNSTSKEISCVEAASSIQVFHCEKRCNRRKDCGRHKCLNHCCVNTEHKCDLICNKKLSCGVHHCQETCHGGKCPSCWNVSFDELRCHCGQNVLLPPIHCGTKPPECNQPCAREHPCGHNLQHSCHSEEQCPPCTVFTVKWCFGHHEQRSHVPCFLDGLSCGKSCDKNLPCGRHKCREICHEGPCLKNSNPCTQPCETLRACGHPCAAPCHDGDCPATSCKAKLNVSCPCGHRTDVVTCSDDNNSYRLLSVSILATKMQDIKAGESVNINDLLGKKSNKNNRLICNEECAIIERNKRLAVALQIQNPDLSCKPGPPNYSEFLREEAKKNPKFVCSVYDKFTEMVQLAKQSKQKSRSYAFPPMNRDQRRVIHEMAEFFGCETQSYDDEPVKNVVITASKDKSWLPFYSIISVIQREMGVRKGPVPLISQTISKTSAPSEKKEKPIDYFDFDD